MIKDNIQWGNEDYLTQAKFTTFCHTIEPWDDTTTTPNLVSMRPIRASLFGVTGSLSTTASQHFFNKCKIPRQKAGQVEAADCSKQDHRGQLHSAYHADVASPAHRGHGYWVSRPHSTLAWQDKIPVRAEEGGYAYTSTTASAPTLRLLPVTALQTWITLLWNAGPSTLHRTLILSW